MPDGAATAHVHFAPGGAAVISKPAWQRHGDDFTYEWPDLPVVVVVNRLHEDRETLSADLTFTSKAGAHVHLARLNLISSRTRAELTKELTKRTDKIPWAQVLEQVCVTTVREWRRPPTSVLLDDLPTYTGDIYLDSMGFLPTGDTALLYGPRESAKTTVAMALAIMMHHGCPAGPVQPLLSGIKTLWLSWEQRERAVKATFAALKRGFGITDRTGIMFIEMERSLGDCANWLRTEVAKHKIGLVVVDSYIPAAGYEPQTNDSASRVFRTLRSFGQEVTSIVISHLAKLDIAKHGADPFGGVTSMNLARSAWMVNRGEDEAVTDHRSFPVGMYQTKNSYGRKRQFALRLDFFGPVGAYAERVDLVSMRLIDDPELAEKGGLRLLIEAHLAASNTWLSVKDIATALSVRPQTVFKTLTRMKMVCPKDRKRQGINGEWGLVEWTKGALGLPEPDPIGPVPDDPEGSGEEVAH